MKITHNIVIVTNQKDTKRGYLKLRTIQNRKVKDRSIGYQILRKNWIENKQQVSKKEPKSEIINQKIDEIIKAARNGSPNSLTSKGDKSFLNFAQKVTDSITSHSTRKNKQDALNKFGAYLTSLGVDDVKFQSIDSFFVQNYYTHLLNNMAIISANTYLVCLKYWWNQAVTINKVPKDPDPFSNLKKQKVTKKYRVVNNEELKKFFQYTPDTHLRKNVYEGFLFMMHSAGLRISDALLMRFENIEQSGKTFYLNYRMKKSGKPMQTKLTIEALRHLFHFAGRYDMSFIEHLEKYETQLAEIEQKRDEHETELSRLHVNTFYRLREEYDDVEVRELEGYTWDSLIVREEKKEARIGYLKFQIEYSRERKREITNELVSNLGEILMELKYDHPKDTIMPYMNDIYSGEHILTEIQEKTLNKYKVHFNDHLRKITEKIDIKTGITPHMARHIFAQRLFLKGVNMHYISMALGHSSLKVTENYREQLVTMDSMDIIDIFSKTLEDVNM